MTNGSEKKHSDVAVVTGGSRGIGKAIVLTLAKQGWRVAFNYATNESAAAEVCKEATEHGGAAFAFKADVRNPDEVAELFRQIKETVGAPSVLVNNAGIIRDAPLMMMKDENWRDVISTNLDGVFFCCRKGIRTMIAQKWGRVINIVSPSGIIGRIGQANYSASKGGVIALTKTLAREVSRFGVTVNAVAPGVIDTEMIHGLPDHIKAEFLKAIPVGRFGRAEEVAGVVAFLASLQAEYITGQIIRIDGGLVM